jgi:holo-[acyl-carrier protein] synthase
MSDLSAVSAGIDLVSVQRIEAIMARWGEKFLRRIYTDREIAYCMSQSFPARSLAARFAAKEAFYKAVSPWHRDPIGHRSVEVVLDDRGFPRIEPHGGAASALAGRGASLSLSHEKEFAVAVVVTSVAEGCG